MEKQMYQRAEICLPRKRKVLESFHSNTFRIFDETLPERLHPTEVYQNHQYPARDPQESELLKTHNLPQPQYARFIRTNVRFLNEFIAHMETRHTVEEQFNWWSDCSSHDEHSKASMHRCDLQSIKDDSVTRSQDSNRPSVTGIMCSCEGSAGSTTNLLNRHERPSVQQDSRDKQTEGNHSLSEL